MVQEELLDITGQIKALTAGRRRSGVRTIAADYEIDRRQYLNWRQEDTALDSGTGDGRARLKAAAVRGLDLLAPRQREMMELYMDGAGVRRIAAELGVNASTVSRTVARAKKHLRESAEQAMTAAQLRSGDAVLDLADPAAANAVMLAMTPKQTAYFYLYYSERLTLREIQDLTGTDYTAVCRALQRALRNIGTLMNGRDTVLKHPEALDELAFQAYCQMERHPELVPEGIPMPPPYHPPKKTEPRRRKTPEPIILPGCIRIRRGRRNGAQTPGKLLQALLKRLENRTGRAVALWMKAVFTALRRRIQTCMKGKTI